MQSIDQESTRRGSDWRQGLLAAWVLGITLQAMTSLGDPRFTEVGGNSTLFFSAVPFGLGVLACAACFLIPWTFIAVPLIRRRGLDPGALASALAILLAVVYLASTAQSDLGIAFVPPPLRRILTHAVGLWLAGTIAWAAYRSLVWLSGRGRRRLLRTLQGGVLLLTLASAGALGIVWARTERLRVGPLGPGVLTLLIAAGVVIVGVGALSRGLSGLRRIPGLLVLAGMVGALVGLLQGPGLAVTDALPNVAAGAPRTVILILVDTLRSDALSCIDPARGASPCIDTLASDGLVYTHAYAEGAWTLPSVTSIQTGLSPSVHEVLHPHSCLSAEFPTLAQHMRGAGYRTGAVVRNAVLQDRNLSRGFAWSRFLPRDRVVAPGRRLAGLLWSLDFRTVPTSRDLTEMAQRWLDANADAPAFLWLHYFDPHMNYIPPPAFRPPGSPPAGLSWSFTRLAPIRMGQFNPNAEQREWIESLYRAEARSVDDCVGDLLDHLRERGLYDDALIVLASDHGEEFWEHGGFEHGHSLFDEVLHVPLVVKYPGNQPHGVIDRSVSVVSLMPTLLALCAPTEALPALSVSALPLSENPSGDDEVASPPLVSTGMLYHGSQEAIRFGRWKYIHWIDSGREALFDLEQDPGELHDLSAADPDTVSQARLLLAQRKSAAARLRGTYSAGADSISLSPDAERRLRSLGYIE